MSPLPDLFSRVVSNNAFPQSTGLFFSDRNTPCGVYVLNQTNHYLNFPKSPKCSRIRATLLNSINGATTQMQELNPIRNQIIDLQSRCLSLRGYL